MPAGTPAPGKLQRPHRLHHVWQGSRAVPEFFDNSSFAHHRRRRKVTTPKLARFNRHQPLLIGKLHSPFYHLPTPLNYRSTTATMSNIASDAQLFEDHFRVERLSDPKYDRVDRIYCHSEPDKSISMSLDINKELFPCKVDDELHVALATSLHYDGSKDDERGWRDVAKAGASDATLADIFDYVCYGKIYKFEDGEDGKTM